MADSVTNGAQPENPDKVALFRGILSHPTDILRRRVFADWLDDYESGNPDSVKRAEYLRGCAESGVGSVVSLCMGAHDYPNWRVFGLYSPGAYLDGMVTFPGETFDRAEDMTAKSKEVLPYLDEFLRVMTFAMGDVMRREDIVDFPGGILGAPGGLFVEIKYGYPQRIWCRSSLWLGTPCNHCNVAVRDAMGFTPEAGCSFCGETGRQGAMGPAIRKRFPIAQVNLMDWFDPHYIQGTLHNVMYLDDERQHFSRAASIAFPKVFMEIGGYEEVFGIDIDTLVSNRNNGTSRISDVAVVTESRITTEAMNLIGAMEPTLKVPQILWPYLRRAKYAHRMSQNRLRRRFVHYPDAEIAYHDWTEALSLWAADVAGILDQETGGVIDHDHSRNYGDAERDDGSPD